MKVAVIGANGFIGSHLSQVLSENSGLNLSLFGRDSKCILKSDADYFQLPALSFDERVKIFKEVDLVYYLASSSIPASTWTNPNTEITSNLIPFLDFLEMVCYCGVKKIAFVSSAGTIYGPSLNKVKEDFDKHPFSPHGIVKLTMENFLDYYRKKSGIAFDIYRVSNVFGEGQKTSKGLGLINTLIENILIKKEINIFGDGSHLRNYIYVKDCVRLMEFSLRADIKNSNVFNLSSDTSFTVNEIIRHLQELFHEQFVIHYTEKRKSDNEFIDIDNSKLLAHFQDFHFTPFRTALENTYRHIKHQLNQE